MPQQPNIFYQTPRKSQDPLKSINRPIVLFNWRDRLVTFNLPKTLRDFLGIEYIEAILDGFKKYECQETGNVIYEPVWKVSKLHPYRMLKSSMASASRSLSKLEKLDSVLRGSGIKEGLKLKEMVLTFPDTLRVTISEKEAWAVFKKFWSFLPKGLAAYVNLHFWSSRNPLDRHVHFHVLMPNIRFIPFKKKIACVWPRQKGKIYLYSEPIYQIEVVKSWQNRDRLLRLWREAILQTLGKKTSYDPQNIYLQYHSVKHNRGKVLHLLKYQGRRPWVDFAHWSMKNDHYLEELTSSISMVEGDDPMLDVLKDLLNYKNLTHTFGWLRHIKQFIGKLEKKDRCPICGGVIKYLGKIEIYGSQDLGDLGLYSPLYLEVGKRGKIKELYEPPPWLGPFRNHFYDTSFDLDLMLTTCAT